LTKHILHASPLNHLPTVTLLLQTVCSECIPFVRCRGVTAVLSAFLSLVTLTFDLDIQTCQSEGPNMSSLQIWCKCVKQFPGYFTHKQKKQTHKMKSSRMALKTEPYLCAVKKPKARIGRLVRPVWAPG